MSDDGGDEADGSDPPEPPVSVPKYIADAIQRQDITKLRRLAAYGQQLTGRTPEEPLMTEEFDADDLAPGDVIRHTSGKSTVRSGTGQIARVMGEEAVEIWDSDGEIKTISTDDIVAVSTGSIERSIADEIRDTADTEAGLPEDEQSDGD